MDMNSWERQLNCDQGFRRALRDLVSVVEQGGARAGTSSALLVPWTTQLRVFALLAVTDQCLRGIRPPDEWDTGKTSKAITNLSLRLRAMAAEIERANRSPFFYLPDFTLPLEMQMYADHIERSLAFAKWRTHEQRGHSRWVVQLSDLVRRETGDWLDEKVCKLLNAAANALNIGFQLDAPALAQARHRSKKSQVQHHRSSST
jgi:hypothetical protein